MLAQGGDRGTDRRRADRGSRAAAEVPRGLPQQHGRQQWRRPADAPHRGGREAHHHRAGQVGRRRGGDPVAVQQREHLALHQRAVAHRVFGLDEQLHRPVPVQDQANQLVQCEQAGVAVGAVRPPAAVPGAPVQLLQLRQRHIADQAGAGRGAVHPAVVHADQVAVAGQPNIAFDAVGALPQRQFVGGQGVLGAVGRRPPMGHHEGMPAVRTVGQRHSPMLPVPAVPAQPVRANRYPPGRASRRGP